MSADLWLEDDDGSELVFDYDHPAVQNVANVSYGNRFNLTYNLTPMLEAAGKKPWREMIGMTAYDAGRHLSLVVAELQAHRAKYECFNPKNGWGDYDHAVQVLSALVVACVNHPEAKIGGWL